MTAPTTTRRTPAQIAILPQLLQVRMLSAVVAELYRLDAETRAARARQAELKQLRDYRAQHPLLQQRRDDRDEVPPLSPDPEIMDNAEGITKDLEASKAAALRELAKTTREQR